MPYFCFSKSKTLVHKTAINERGVCTRKGTIQQLKERLGAALILDVRLTDAERAADVHQWVRQQWSHATSLSEKEEEVADVSSATNLQFRIPRADVPSLSASFRSIEAGMCALRSAGLIGAQC